MIVGCSFDADDDARTAWKQHDVYRDALRFIVEPCRVHVNFAITLLELQWPKRWVTDLSFDRQTLQGAYDLLTAAWRFRTNSIQLALPFDGKPAGTEARMQV